MPIRPENRGRYPENWKWIRAKILERSGSRCEWEGCGVANYAIHPETGSRVVLTIAHLDHQPENNDFENLRAWCQLHHNRYDAPFRAANRARRRAEA